MEENVRKELDALRGMVLTWKKDYLGSASPEGDCEYLAREFMEEVETHVYPYVRRLSECDYLTGPEAKEFLEFCYGQVQELSLAIRQPDAKQGETTGG
jgi:hypothetical protein